MYVVQKFKLIFGIFRNGNIHNSQFGKPDRIARHIHRGCARLGVPDSGYRFARGWRVSANKR